MPRCACASEVYGSVCVCRLLQLLKDQSSVSKSFYSTHVYLDFNLWDLQNNALFSSYAYLKCHCSLFRRVHSKTCPWSVATLLSSWLCTRTLAIGSCNSEKRAARLCTDAAINFRHELLASIVFNNNHDRSLPTDWLSLWFWIFDSGFCLVQLFMLIKSW